MPLPHIVAGDLRDGDVFGHSVFMFEHWSFIGDSAPYSKNSEHICIEEIAGPLKCINNHKRSMGVVVIGLVELLKFVRKT